MVKAFNKKYFNIFSRHVAVVLSFAIIYFIIHENIPNSFKSNKPDLNFLDFLYFSLTTQTTVGYGDIDTKHIIPRLFNILQMFTILGLLFI
jgi:hypothetical protein